VSSCCGVYRSAVGTRQQSGPGLSVSFNAGLPFFLSGCYARLHCTRCLSILHLHRMITCFY
jgi:hypothetical protein